MYRKYRPWIALGLMALVAAVWMAVGIKADAYKTNEPENMNAFEPYEIEDVAAGVFTQKTVNVFVETEASMRGFIDPRKRTGCMPQAYRDMLLALDETVKPLGTDVRCAYYAFNKAWQGESTRQALLDTGTYSAGTEESRARMQNISELNAALQNVDPSALTMIFTDLEGGSPETDEALRSLAAQCFSAGNAMVIQRFYSAFGGVLYNYGGTGLNVGYGVEDRVGGIANAVVDGQPYYHLMPRAFYIILIGPGDECEILRQRLYTLYEALNAGYQDTALACGGSHDKALYHGYDEVRYDIIRPERTLRAFGDGLSLGQTQGAVLDADSPWAKDTHSVHQFTLDKSAGLKTASIPFTLAPALKGFGQSYFAVSEEPILNLYKVTQEDAELSVGEDGLIQPKPLDFLLGRGFKGKRMVLAPYQKASGVFTVTRPMVSGETVSSALNVDLFNCEPGLYRAVIQINLRPNVSDNAQTVEPKKAAWSVTPGDYPNLATTRWTGESNPYVRTADAARKLNVLWQAYNASEAEVSFRVANVTIDLKVQ